jgi:hypothetical protein
MGPRNREAEREMANGEFRILIRRAMVGDSDSVSMLLLTPA